MQKMKEKSQQNLVQPFVPEQNHQGIFNNVSFNPEVIKIKTFLVITIIFMFLAIGIAIFASFLESTENAFPIVQFAARFVFCVVIPVIVYLNNDKLRHFVYEMFVCFLVIELYR